MDALDVVSGTGVPFVARVVLAVGTCGLTMSSPAIKGLRINVRAHYRRPSPSRALWGFGDGYGVCSGGRRLHCDGIASDGDALTIGEQRIRVDLSIAGITGYIDR